MNLAVRAGETSRLLQTRDGGSNNEIVFWDKIVRYSSASFVASFSRGYTGSSLMQGKEVMPYVCFLTVISETDHANVNLQFCLVSLAFHAVIH